MNAPQILAPQIILTPRRPAVLAGFQNTLDVLVRVAAPDAPPSAGHSRAPLHLALVIDRSGSMAGQPLEEAKKAVAFVINGLMRGDRATLVTYADIVDTQVPRMTNRLAPAAESLTPGEENASYLRRKTSQGKQQPDSPDKR